jgi:mannose-6-phosphate isomerase
MHIQKKPWGKEEILETNDKYTVKLLLMKKGCRCSLQYHEYKHETIYVVSGKLKLYISPNKETPLTEFVLLPGNHHVIPPNTIHRMEGLDDSYYIEASTSELKDVVRLNDDYGRI